MYQSREDGKKLEYPPNNFLLFCLLFICATHESATREKFCKSSSKNRWTKN